MINVRDLWICFLFCIEIFLLFSRVDRFMSNSFKSIWVTFERCDTNTITTTTITTRIFEYNFGNQHACTVSHIFMVCKLSIHKMLIIVDFWIISLLLSYWKWQFSFCNRVPQSDASIFFAIHWYVRKRARKDFAALGR